MSDDERFDDGIEKTVAVSLLNDSYKMLGIGLYLMKNGTVRWKIED